VAQVLLQVPMVRPTHVSLLPHVPVEPVPVHGAGLHRCVTLLQLWLAHWVFWLLVEHVFPPCIWHAPANPEQVTPLGSLHWDAE
jgi:hypothetical protein